MPLSITCMHLCFRCAVQQQQAMPCKLHRLCSSELAKHSHLALQVNNTMSNSSAARNLNTREFGPHRLARFYLGDNRGIGTDEYLADWGASGGAVMAQTGEGWRYIASTFVHADMAHLLVVGTCAIVAATLVERRCGPSGGCMLASARWEANV